MVGIPQPVVEIPQLVVEIKNNGTEGEAEAGTQPVEEREPKPVSNSSKTVGEAAGRPAKH